MNILNLFWVIAFITADLAVLALRRAFQERDVNRRSRCLAKMLPWGMITLLATWARLIVGFHQHAPLSQSGAAFAAVMVLVGVGSMIIGSGHVLSLTVFGRRLIGAS